MPLLDLNDQFARQALGLSVLLSRKPDDSWFIASVQTVLSTQKNINLVLFRPA
jgi:hypothetical protein